MDPIGRAILLAASSMLLYLAHSQAIVCQDFYDPDDCSNLSAETCKWYESTLGGLCGSVCPMVHWIGGTQQEICKAQDRCNCNDGTKTCCILDGGLWESGVVDEYRQHLGNDACKLDVQKADSDAENTEDQGTSPGYLLTLETHQFGVTILPEGYDCDMVIHWKFEWLATDCNYENGRRRLVECDPDSTSLEQAGLSIDNVAGTLTPSGADDTDNLVVEFTVSSLSCDGDAECYDGVALYGKLKIVYATSLCRYDCWDPRIYPFDIPVWYNHADAFVAPTPSNLTSTKPSQPTETELPPSSTSTSTKPSDSTDNSSQFKPATFLQVLAFLFFSVAMQ